ncbi:metallophosphoesterase 1-like [Chenopodium quinoa]|uniref:metallophosphoesterase 1-like n=1 Tax=Chenopodium quinoa TaxID=63459 RepID=UPI000B783FA8|nr:metallophosphoesterase 1-like [Chenopodium quinoa]
MSNSWKIILSVTLFATLFDIYQHQITIPSCKIANANSNQTLFDDFDHNHEDLTAILVSNLLLRGSDSSFFDLFFRDYFLSQFFSKSFDILKPDILLVLGDVSAKGFELTSKKWSSVVEQFERILGPYLHLPFHVTLGDRDIGECSKLKASLVRRVASSFPELNRGGCGSFGISNVSFISINAMALLCGNNELLSDVETVIETESAYLQTQSEDGEQSVKLNAADEASYQHRWRDNPTSPQSGPVLLLHIPLQQISNSYCNQESSSSAIWNSLPNSLKKLWRADTDSGPYDLLHTIPPNASEYIFQALKPRIIFSAHSHKFCDVKHPDGTREVTVPALAWTAKDDPGFIVATFRRNEAVVVRHCSLPRESHVVVSFIAIFVLSISPAVITILLHRLNVRYVG